MAFDNVQPSTDSKMTFAFNPPWLALFLLYWGYCTDFFAIALAFSLIVEGIKVSPYRWDLNAKHFQRVADFTSVLFAVVVVYQFIEYAFHGIYGILGLLPVCLLPLVIAQRVSNVGLLPMSSLFLSLRRQIQAGTGAEIWVSAEFIYALVCIFAASGGELPKNFYFFSATALVVVLLYAVRASQRGMDRWLLSVTMTIGLAVALLISMQTLYLKAESSFSYWFQQFAYSQTNPSKTRTAIGQIGRLKLSDRIKLRVVAPFSIPLPLYLQEATYITFKLGSWTAGNASPVAIDPEPNTTRWHFSKGPAPSPSYDIEITTHQPTDVTVQPLPRGTVIVEGDEIIELQRNEFGTTLLEAIPGQLRYRTLYEAESKTPQLLVQQTRRAEDLIVPPEYRDVIDKIADEINLMQLPTPSRPAAIAEFFNSQFKYSLINRGYYPGRRSLSSFLTSDRYGHCEYFASATVLLLRKAGFPARYAVGYVVDEYSAIERAFVARARHAHAWADALIDGKWQVVDTTPANWFELEQARVSGWQTLQDYLSWVRYRFARFQRIDRSEFNQWIIWLIPILVVVLLWRLRGRMRTKSKPLLPEQQTSKRNIDDFELLKLIDSLKSHGYQLPPGGTALSVLSCHLVEKPESPRIVRLVDLHNKQRFSSLTLTPKELAELRDGIHYYLTLLRVGAVKSGARPASR